MPAVSLQLNAFVPAQLPAVRQAARPARPGGLRRFLQAVERAQMRRAERQVAEFIAWNGGRLTDSLEREIERRFA